MRDVRGRSYDGLVAYQFKTSSSEPKITRWLHGKGVQISPKQYQTLVFITLVAMVAIVFSGGAVRLTQSGLGCSTWPNCTSQHLVATFSFHPMIEFTNRMLTILFSVTSIVTFIATLARRPFRKDLFIYASGLIVGLLANIVLGGITVLEKLAPPYVMAHFVLALLVVWDALVLWILAKHGEGEYVLRVTKETKWLGRLLIGALTLVVSVGTAVSGTGPHSGSPISKRLPFALRDVAQLHADLVLFFIGLTLAGLLLLRQERAPQDIQHLGIALLITECFQGFIGYTQYFSGLPSLLVEFHIVGATALWIIVFLLYHSFFLRPPREDEIPSESSEHELVTP